MTKLLNHDHSGNKCVNSYLCCWCFFTKGTFEGDSDIYFSDKDEPCEYIVEKLAIKKVPISLFTMSDNYKKRRSQNSEKSSSTHSISTPPSPEQKPSVSFSSYYKLQEPDETNDNPSPSSKDNKSRSFDDMVKEREIVSTMLPAYTPRRSLTEKQSIAIVTNVLNKHSSLFTLDTKTAIPKDPNHLPSNRMVVPPSVRHAVKKQQRNLNRGQEREVYAEVHHHTPGRKSNERESYSPHRQDIARSIQTTIDSLKYTQKPHLPGIPPKNQRSLKNSISDTSSEKEFYCVAPIQTMTPASKAFNQNVATNSKMFTNQNVKNACDYEIYYNKLHRESKERDKYFPFHAQAKQNTVVQKSHWYPQARNYVEYDDKRKVYTVPAEDEFHGPYHLRRGEYYNPKYHEGTGENGQKEKPDKSKDQNIDKNKDNDNKNKNLDQSTTRNEKVEDQQIADVLPKQGQNLKWKIIVKHHQDKKSDDGETSGSATGEETSESVGIPRRR